MSLLALAGTNSATGGYDIDNSCKFEADNVEYLTRTPSSDSDRQKFTISLWVKRTELGTYQTLYGAQPSSGYSNANTFQFAFTNDDKIGLGLQTYWVFQTNAVYRDTSAWYHIVVRADTTQPFSHNRIRLYVNGTQNSSFSVNALSNIAEDQLFGVNHTTRQQIGSLIANSWHSSCYISEVNLVDGQSHAPSYFGEFDEDSGIWKPKKYAGTYGTNGFYLNFDNASAMGADSSGNNNNWSLNNITAADQATDTPTNNFCTLNPLDNNWANVPTINEGATTHMLTSPGVWRGSSGTIAVSKGKWYWEIKTTNSGGNLYMIGIGSTEYGEVPGSQSPHDVLNFAGLYLANSATEGGLFVTDSTGGSVYRNAFNPGANHSANDIYGFALDLDSSPQTITFYRNGTNINPSSGAPLDIAGACSILPVTIRLSIYEREAQCNFGGYTEFSIASGNTDDNGYGTFEYAPPSGYYALCTKNLEEYG